MKTRIRPPGVGRVGLRRFAVENGRHQAVRVHRFHRCPIRKVARVEQHRRVHFVIAQPQCVRDIRYRDRFRAPRDHRLRDPFEPESVGVRLERGDDAYPGAGNAPHLGEVVGNGAEVDPEHVRPAGGCGSHAHSPTWAMQEPAPDPTAAILPFGLSPCALRFFAALGAQALHARPFHGSAHEYRRAGRSDGADGSSIVRMWWTTGHVVRSGSPASERAGRSWANRTPEMIRTPPTR